MIKQEVKFRAPIKIIPSDNYLLIIEDADGIRHYFDKEDENCIKGEYDGWSVNTSVKMSTKAKKLIIEAEAKLVEVDIVAEKITEDRVNTIKTKPKKSNFKKRLYELAKSKGYKPPNNYPK